MSYYLSYLMGASNIQDKELQDLNIEIVDKKESGSRKLKLPQIALTNYISLVKEKLSEGFWNEIVGEDKIIFIFKFKNGSIKEYILTSDNQAEIGKLCSKFNGDSIEKTANVYKYISENDFYHNLVVEHYTNFINH